MNAMRFHITTIKPVSCLAAAARSCPHAHRARVLGPRSRVRGRPPPVVPDPFVIPCTGGSRAPSCNQHHTEGKDPMFQSLHNEIAKARAPREHARCISTERSAAAGHPPRGGSAARPPAPWRRLRGAWTRSGHAAAWRSLRAGRRRPIRGAGRGVQSVPQAIPSQTPPRAARLPARRRGRFRPPRGRATAAGRRHRRPEARDVHRPAASRAAACATFASHRWDALHSGWQRRELDAWMAAAHMRRRAAARHVRPRTQPQREAPEELPRPARLAHELRMLRKRYPWVRQFASWNEANYCGEKTCHRPALVAALLPRAQARMPALPDPRRRAARRARHDQVGQGVHPQGQAAAGLLGAAQLPRRQLPAHQRARARCCGRPRARSGSPRRAGSSSAATARRCASRSRQARGDRDALGVRPARRAQPRGSRASTCTTGTPRQRTTAGTQG